VTRVSVNALITIANSDPTSLSAQAQLTYNCTCANGTTPNVGIYSESLPAKICTEWVAQCVNSHPNDLDAITKCHATKCGDQNSSALAVDNSASSSSSAAPSSTPAPSQSASGSASAAATSASSTGAAAAATALAMAKTYGTGIMAAGMFAVFGLAL
jgi:hypothetical protein